MASRTTEVVYNPSCEMLFDEETKPELEGYEKVRSASLSSKRYDWYLHRPFTER